ncbi:hypothetical protein FDF31_11345 [Clostridium sporogenes]|nr:hypothetical protein [Clostridium sporogenes]NFS26204.1 hypothetical protein [Clostridium sporogenes]
MSSKNININFEELVEIFNNKGKPTAEKYVQETYGIAYNVVQRRLVKETSYAFDRANRRYAILDKADEAFISRDNLFKGKTSIKNEQKSLENIEVNFNDILTDMVKDRLIELSKYFNICQSSKEIFINMKLLKSSGYKLSILE